MFYVFCDVDSKHAYFLTDDDGAPRTFDTETEAIDAAKEYCGERLVLRAVARVTERTTHKVEKIK